jgi:PAS domain S-box-containing protein
MVEPHSSIFSRLRGLLHVTRLVRSESDLPTLLDELARTVAESLGFRTVVVNLYRPAWDAFQVTAVHGNDEARELLLGETRDSSTWVPLLDERFERRGAYLIPHGEFDWDEDAVASYVPDVAGGDDPGAWHPEDALFVPMRHTDGHLLGVLSVDEPLSGRTPGDDELDVLVAVASHAAIALQSAQEGAEAARHRLALERLLAVSATITDTRSLDEVLAAVCAAVRDALGFGTVTVELHDAATGALAVRAAVGVEDETTPPLNLEQVERLREPQFEVEGCYLVPHAEARARLADAEPRRPCPTNGRGPHAWSDHRLFVPLRARDGSTGGFLWVDTPGDRLLPSPERLQALRAFANQAASALDAAAQFEALRVSNERRQALIDASPLAIVDLGTDGHVRSWNPAAERMFGWRADEVLGKPLPTVPPERVPELQGNLARVLAGESTQGIELERRRRDGARIEIDLSSAPLTDSTGAVSGVISVMADVTERRRAERALVASEARTAAVLEAALDSVITIDHAGRIVEFNRAAEETFGWTSGEVVGRGFLEVAIPQAHRSGLDETFRSGATPLLGTRLEIEALHSDGRTFAAELVVSRVAVGGPPLFTACLRDITRRKAQEEQLRETAAKYRTLVERLPIATYLNDLGLPIRTTWISPQIESMLGYLPEEWLADGFFEERVHPDDRARVLVEVERTHETGETFRSEYRLLAKDGRVVRVRDETVAVRDEEYRPLFLQGFLIDIGERDEPDELPGAAERLRLVG